MQIRELRRREARAAPLDDVPDPLLRRVLSHRGAHVHTRQPRLADLLSWKGLKGIDEAAELLREAIRRRASILVVGDYDADGATGVTLAVKALKLLGAAHVEHLVPDRVKMGYGLSPALAQMALGRKPALVITVDNGISSIEGVRLLRSSGVQVLITDHHLPGKELPDADAIVNPNQPGCGFESKALAGVGVVFYLMLALRAHLQAAGELAEPAPKMVQFLDLVALGTVADLVPLDINNRLLVSFGLARMRGGLARPGIAALIEAAGREAGKLTEQDLGFALGPRINAAGRLEHMDQGIACLLSDSQLQARPLAQQLDRINRERRDLQAQSQELAEANLPKLTSHTRGLCVFDAQWHEGIVGLLASRLKEQCHRPVIAFAASGERELKGSGRSIAGFHLRDALAQVDALNPGLIKKFGGHAMAAGLSIDADKFSAFQAAFGQICDASVSDEALTPVWFSDGELATHELSAASAQILRDGGPWGQGWERPLFDGVFEIESQKIVGQGHLKLRVQSDGRRFDAIAFGVDEIWPNRTVHLVFELDINDYYSPVRPQLLVRGAVAAD